MNLRTTLILFGILAVFLGVFAALQLTDYKTQAERTEQDKWLMPTLKVANVTPRDFTTVLVERADDKPITMEFKKEDGEWKMVQPKALRADGAAVDRLIDQLVRAERPVNQPDNAGANLAEYGLDKPAVKITLTLDDKKATEIKAANKTFTFTIGKSAADKKNTLLYVLTSEVAKSPVGIARTRLDRAFAPLDDYRSKELISSTFNVESVKLAGAKRSALALEKVDGKDWVFKEPKLGDADMQQVNDLTQNLGMVKVERNEDFVYDGPLDDAKLQSYGLKPDQAPYVITVKHKDAKEKTETVFIGNKDPEATRKASEVDEARKTTVAALLGPMGTTVLAPLNAGEAANAKLGQDGYYFARLGDDNSVVRIPAKHVKAFEKKADDLRSKTLARVDGAKVDAINVTAGGETVRLRRPKVKVEGTTVAAPSEWVVWSDRQNKDVKAHLDVVTKVIDALNKVELPDSKNFLDDDARQRAWFGMDPVDLGLDKPEAEVLVWQEGIKRDKDGKPEGTGEPQLKDDVKNKPLVKLSLGKKDPKRGVVYVKRQRGDDPAVVLAVPDPWVDAKTQPPPQPGTFPPPRQERISLSDRVNVGYLGFRDHVLPSFKLNEATKLTYVQRGTTYEAEKEAKPDASPTDFAEWKLTKPVQAKSENADNLAFQLSRIAADKLVSDKATDQDRKDKYGLATPFLAATVTTSDKDKKVSTYTYAIGKKITEGPDANKYYARIEVKPADGTPPDANDFVFLLPMDAVRPLDLELRDGTIFAAESSIGSVKPEEITFTWRDKAKQFQESKLEVTPSGDGDKKVWTVKSLTVNGMDAKASLPKLDAAKVDSMLGLAFGKGPRLNPLHTERFLINDGKPAANQRLDESSKESPPALVIELKYPDKSVRKLIVGDPCLFIEDLNPGLRQKGYYYATASTVPNAVFIVGENEFKDLLAGPDYFKAAEKVAVTNEPRP